MTYTTIMEQNVRYADYCDISAGKAAMAAMGIPSNLVEIGVGKTLQATGTAVMAVGCCFRFAGKFVRKDGEKRLDHNKKTVESWKRMR